MAVKAIGKLHGVPELPPHYLPREADLVGLKEKLLAGGASVGITGRSSAVGVQGMGGIGKTVLAAALAHDSEVRQAFPDGIYWLTIGQKPNLLDLQNQLLRQLTISKQTLTTEREAKDALREALEGRTALVVVDDAWTIDDADAFSVTAAAARLILTTRMYPQYNRLNVPTWIIGPSLGEGALIERPADAGANPTIAVCAIQSPPRSACYEALPLTRWPIVA